MKRYYVGYGNYWEGDPISYEIEWTTHDDNNCTERYPDEDRGPECMSWDSCKGFTYCGDRVANLQDAEKLYREIIKDNNLFHHPLIIKQVLDVQLIEGRRIYFWEDAEGEDKYECRELFDDGGDA